MAIKQNTRVREDIGLGDGGVPVSTAAFAAADAAAAAAALDAANAAKLAAEEKRLAGKSAYDILFNEFKV